MREEASKCNGLKIVYSIKCWENWTDTCRKMKLDLLSTPHTRKIQNGSNLNVRPKTIKIMEENIGSKILDIACRNFIGYISPSKENKKKKLEIWDYIKLKSLCTAKEINKIKRQPR